MDRDYMRPDYHKKNTSPKKKPSLKPLLKNIRERLTLKNFTILSILLIMIGFLPNYLPMSDYQTIFQYSFEIGVLFFILAYVLYAVKCWGVRHKICAVLMISIPLLVYSVATSKIPDSTPNLFLYLVLWLCIFAFVSACLLYILDKGRRGFERHVLKRAGGSYRHFYPKLSHSLVGLLVVSLLAVNYGGMAMFTNNLTGALQSATNSGTNSQYILPTAVSNTAGYATVQTTQVILFNQPTFTSVDESMKDIDYMNTIRASTGVNSIKFDRRVYNLALARVNDMDKYGYLDHTNPRTGTCAFSIKSQFGLTSNEYVAENAYGYESSTGVNYYTGIEKSAINAWMSDRGHKYNMLYPHIAGAVACSSGGHCVFEGLNHDEFTNACYTAAQGEAFWNTASVQPFEHT
jgi:uncharacterized protein YkwD